MKDGTKKRVRCGKWLKESKGKSYDGVFDIVSYIIRRPFI